MKHIALVGAGGHSLGCHAPALQHYAKLHPDRVTLQVVCDLDIAKARAAASQFGFRKAVASIPALFDKTNGPIDAVVAVMPIPAVLPSTRELLKYNVPLTIEKPLGRDLAEAKAVVKVVRDAGAMDRVMVSFNRRFDPGLRMAAEWVAGQKPVRYVRASMIRSGRSEPDFVWGTGIHVIDALISLVGPLTVLKPVRCPAGNDQWRVVEMESRSGTQVHLEILPTCGEWEERVRLTGEGYTVDAQSGVLPPWRVRAVKDMKLEVDASSPQGEPGFVSNGTYGETEAFIDAVCSGGPMPVGVDAALVSSELAAEIGALCGLAG